MARLLKFNGMVVEIYPENKQDFSTEELFELVGGSFELIELTERHQTLVVLKDESVKKLLPENFLAQALAGIDGVKGNALLCDLKELK